jgi:hypothetical protein
VLVEAEKSCVTHAFAAKLYDATAVFVGRASTLFCDQAVGKVGGVVELKFSLHV